VKGKIGEMFILSISASRETR